MQRRELKRDKEVCGGHGSAETWMEKEKHLGLGCCIPAGETERPQHEEEGLFQGTIRLLVLRDQLLHPLF